MSDAMVYQKDIEKALEVLNSGGIFLYPTDTVWGIGCDATNEKAVERIFAVKQRNEARALLTLVNGLDMLAEYVENIPSVAMELITDAMGMGQKGRGQAPPLRPLSIIYPKAKNLALNLIADDGSIGIRVVNEPFCLQLIKSFGKPIVSTSANISGETTPATFDEISDEIKTRVDYIVRWRQDDREPAMASSIIKLFDDGTVKTLR